MRAAVFHGPGDLRIEEVADPAPAPDEVVLEIHAAGLCGTDAHEYAAGPVLYAPPLVPGHEFAGRVVALGGDVHGLAEGDLVASGAGISCGECAWCLQGRTNLCADYTTMGLQRDGALAQFVAVPAAICAVVEPDGLDDDTASLAQPMAIAAHALARGRPVAGEPALVIGVGGIGAFLTFAAVEAGLDVTVADLDPGRLAIAAKLGAHRTIKAEPGMALAGLLADVPRPTVVYEVTGSAAGLEGALARVERGGRLVQVGLHGQPRRVPLRAVALDEVDLLGTQALVFARDVPEALRLLAARADPWSDIAPRALSLDRLVPDGLEPLVEGRSGVIKLLVDPWARAERPTRMGG